MDTLTFYTYGRGEQPAAELKLAITNSVKNSEQLERNLILYIQNEEIEMTHIFFTKPNKKL